MSALISVVVGFLLTGLIGNRLVQEWQTRNWLLQQRFLGHEKEYVALKELADELASLMGARIYLMRRLNRALSIGSAELVSNARIEYDEILKRWNQRLPSFYVALPIVADAHLAHRLESSIQSRFVIVGHALESALLNHQQGVPSPKSCSRQIEADLDSLQGRSIAFNNRVLNTLHSKRADVYFGKRLRFARENLHCLTTWQLVKTLFVRDVDSFSIVRSPLDS